MSIVVLRGNIIEIKSRLVFCSNLHSNHLQMKKMLPLFKRGVIYLLKSAHTSSIRFFYGFLGKLCKFEVAVPQLRTFHMDLHPPTHVQLRLPTVDVNDMLRLSVMQIFRSIGNHLHIGINHKKN